MPLELRRLAMSDTILAVDLGRYKSVACVYARSTREHTFHTLDTTPAELDTLLARHPGAVVVIEACANAGWVHDHAAAKGHPVKVANTAAESWKFQHLKRKTDKDDARRLAELEAIGQLPTVALPEPAVRQRRMLIAARQELVGRRVACQNRIRALFAGQGLPVPRGARAWTAAGLKGIEGQSKELAECGPDELWRGVLNLAVAEYRSLVEQIEQAEKRLDAIAAGDEGTRILESIPGVGPRTAEAVAAHLGDPHRFASGEAGGGVRRAGPEAVPERGDGPEGSDHPARAGGAAEAAGGVRLVHAAVQPVGEGPVRPADGRGVEPEEAGDRGPGAEAAGAVLGDAADEADVADGPGAGGGREPGDRRAGSRVTAGR